MPRIEETTEVQSSGTHHDTCVVHDVCVHRTSAARWHCHPRANSYARLCAPGSRARSRQAGFNLVELMIVVAIVGVLAGVAYPGYQSYAIRATRSAAQSFMLEVANREERFLLDQRAYTVTLGTGGLNTSAPAQVAAAYAVTVAVDNTATPPTFTVTATPLAGTRQASDGTLTLDSVGNKTPSGKW